MLRIAEVTGNPDVQNHYKQIYHDEELNETSNEMKRLVLMTCDNYQL